MQIDSQKIQEIYSLKFNLFNSEKPSSAIHLSSRMAKEAWRLENLALDGGVGAIIGDPGTGKSTFLRYLSTHFDKIPDIQVVHIDRPQSSVADFYRELGNVFGIELRVSHRFGSFKALRDKWSRHIQTTLLRPILMVDEAQLMHPQTLTELRLLSSEKFDSR